MAIIVDRVRETTETSGTGPVLLRGAQSGWLPFSAIVPNNALCPICIADQGSSNYEVSLATYNSTNNTLARTIILSSSNDNRPVSFGANIKDIFLTVPASYLRHEYNPLPYGAAWDGVTDDTAAVNAMLADWYSTGGDVVFPPGTGLIAGQLVLPNNGASIPLQPNGRWIGAGAHSSGIGSTPSGGTILNLTYSGSGAAKIITLGAGSLEIKGITFVDSGTDTVPFLLTTNTQLHLHDFAIVGTGMQQDGIILGGTQAVQGNSPNDGFQGYGTVIESGYFNNIRTAVRCQTWANSVVIRALTAWTGCGGDATHAFIEVDGLTGNTTSGVVIESHTIEMVNYVYGIRLSNCNTCTIRSCGFYDPGPSVLASIRFESGASYNRVESGFYDSVHPLVSDADGTNSVINTAQGQTTVWKQPCVFPTASNQPSVTYQQTTPGNSTFDTVLLDPYGNTLTRSLYVNPNTQNVTYSFFYKGNSRTFSDGVLNSTTTLTSATANFVQQDVGKTVSGTGIPSSPATTISSVNSATSVTMSAAATATSTNVTVAITAPIETLFQLARDYPGEEEADSSGTIFYRIMNSAGNVQLLSKSGSTCSIGDSSYQSAVYTIDGVTQITSPSLVLQNLIYGPNVSFQPLNGAYGKLSVTDGNACTIQNANLTTGNQLIALEITNNSGGTINVSFNSQYALVNGAWVNPQNGKRRHIWFWFNGSNWVEMFRSPNDY